MDKEESPELFRVRWKKEKSNRPKPGKNCKC